MAQDPNDRFRSAAMFADALRDWLERDAQLRLLPRSSVTDRLRGSLSAKLTKEAEEQRRRVTDEQSLRAALKPLALTVETAAIEAFNELHSGIQDLAPHISLSNADLATVKGAEEERDGRGLVSPLVRLDYSNIDRSINFSRVRRGVDLWKSTAGQISGFDLLETESKSLSLLWVVWSGGSSQSPKEIVRGLIGIVAHKATGDSHIEMIVLGLRRHRTAPEPLPDPLSIKDHVLECLGDALQLDR
jgi:hypothetical protein